MLLLQSTLDPEVQAAADSLSANFNATVDEAVHGWAAPIAKFLKYVPEGVIEVVLKMLLALLIYFIGKWLIKRVLKVMGRIMERRSVDLSLRSFLNSLVKITLIVTLIFTVIGILGINTTSFIALFASAGLAIGMALSGTLQNFAGGVMILLVRPFRVGDFIEAQGQSGTVKSIQLTYTVLNTSDNKTIYLPNGPTSTGIINNYSHEERRRVEWVFGIDYGNDYDYAKTTIQSILERDSRIFKDQPILVAVQSLGDSSVNIVVRGWALQKDYWDVFFDVNEEVFKAFSAKGINIPFPQMDVHLYTEDAPKRKGSAQAMK